MKKLIVVLPIVALLFFSSSKMIDCLQSEDAAKQAYRYHFLELMRNMMPDYDTALRLTQPTVKETIAKAAKEAPPCPTWEGKAKLHKL